MKEKRNIILGILLIIGVCFLTTGCKFEKITTEEFKKHFSALGYTISETEEAPYESKTYVVASKEDVPYKIEYYEFEKEVDAKKVLKKYEDSIVNYITSDSQNQKTTGAIMGKIVAVSDNEYIVMSRIQNTLIFVAGTKDYQQEIDKLLGDITY